jgi:VWFA-related protein
MGFCRRTAAALFIVVIAPATSHAQAVQRSLYVSVLNDAGAPVPDLGPSDFIVREDGLAREVLRVAPATDPMQIAVLVDNSQAARDDIADLRKALHAFVTAMTAGSAAGGKNELAIIGLADRPTILTDYTSDRTKLLKGVDRIFSTPQSGTLLLQAIIEACQGFKKHEAARPVIVAVTTEGPELSDRYYDLVLEPLLASGAAFHAIVLGPPGGGTSDAARDRGVVLDRGTRETGGRHDNVLTSMSLTSKLAEVAAELTHQYKVTYARPQSLIPPEHVTVAAAKAGMTARGTLIKERQPRKP